MGTTACSGHDLDPGRAAVAPRSGDLGGATPDDGLVTQWREDHHGPDAGTQGDAQGDAAPSPTCVPEAGVDEPDPDFVDSNCDGIDGDASAAVFVAPSGSDAAVGSMAEPVRTIARAISLAAAAGKSVYACNGVYDENVHLDGAAVSLHGGYDCARGWRRVRDRAIVKPSSGVPLAITAVARPVIVDRFAFRAPDATAPSDSSIAASVAGSTVHFVRVELAAGNGAPGSPGAAVSSTWPNVKTARDGESAIIGPNDTCYEWDHPQNPICSTIARGGASLPTRCATGGFVVGGAGGDGGNVFRESPAGPGMPGTPASPSASKSAGPGGNGAPGEPGTAFGSIREGRYWTTNSGKNGRAGAPGFGGRGGNGGPSYADHSSPVASFAPGGGGGQGGFPGCGGEGGNAGTPGGASIALVVSDGTVDLAWSVLISSRGGDGGGGSDGKPGQKGGPGGAGGKGSCMTCDGRPGGAGGDGGSGGPGGPGGGGPSLGVASVRSSITTSNVDFQIGRPGMGGASSAGSGADGAAGEAFSADAPGDAGK